MAESGVIIPEVVWPGPGDGPHWRQGSPCNQRCPYMGAHPHGHPPHHGGGQRNFVYEEPVVSSECEGRLYQNEIQNEAPTALAPGSYGQLTEQLNAWLASPSPFFGAPWELVLLLGFGAWALFKPKGGR